MPDRYFAKYTGVVTDNVDTQNLGRLYVSVPAIFPPEETVIARAALPYGVFFVPDVDAKVWVEFEGGDPGLPIWTGIQHIAGDWADEAAVSPPRRRVIRTARGHLLIFEDDPNEERIEISSNARIVIHSLGQVEISAPIVTINGRPVAPLSQPI